MKKTFLIAAAALAMGTAAIAQDMPAQTPPSSPTPDMQATPAPAAPATPDASMAPAPAPADNSAAMPAAAPTDTSNYPPCSKGMTDKCVQREGGSHAGHKTWHKKR